MAVELVLVVVVRICKIYKCYLGVDFTRYFLDFMVFGVSFVSCVFLLLRLHTMPHNRFLWLWGILLPLGYKKRKLVELRIVRLVRITAGLGTMALLVGSV